MPTDCETSPGPSVDFVELVKDHAAWCSRREDDFCSGCAGIHLDVCNACSRPLPTAIQLTEEIWSGGNCRGVHRASVRALPILGTCKVLQNELRHFYPWVLADADQLRLVARADPPDVAEDSGWLRKAKATRGLSSAELSPQLLRLLGS